MLYLPNSSGGLAFQLVPVHFQYLDGKSQTDVNYLAIEYGK